MLCKKFGMGCGTSKENLVAERDFVHQKNSGIPESAVASTKVEIKAEAAAGESVPTIPQEETSGPHDESEYAHQLPSPEGRDGAMSIASQEGNYELADLENTLADAAVFHVLQSIQTSVPTEGTVGDRLPRQNTLTPIKEQSENIQLPGEETTVSSEPGEELPILSSLPVIEEAPVPSCQPPSDEAQNASKLFGYSLKKACKISENSVLPTLATAMDTIRLDRSFYCFADSSLLSETIGAMNHLRVLDLRGGQCGPTAFRIMVYALMNDKHVRDLNLSDNLANPECSECLEKLLSNNSTIEILDVSGNQLGKDALSRYMGNGLSKNQSLKSLNISGCGATDLHCLCESLANFKCNVLTTLIASHNNMSDGNLFGVDVALILERSECKLKSLDVTNTSITPSGMNAIIETIPKNSSLESLSIGQNTMNDVLAVGMTILYCCTHQSLKYLNLNKTNLENGARASEDLEMLLRTEVADICGLNCLSIADCGLNDSTVQTLATKLDGKLTAMKELDLSNNNHMSVKNIALFDKMCGENLQGLKVGLFEQLEGISTVLTSHFAGLKSVDFTRSRFAPNDIKDVCSSSQQNWSVIKLDGIKLSGTGAISAIANARFVSSLTSLKLSGCQLIDEDVTTLMSAIKDTSPMIPMKSLDISVNRLSSKVFGDLVESLLTHSLHPLKDVDASGNIMDGACIQALGKLLTTNSHTSALRSVNLSCNDITAAYVITFFSAFKEQRYPLDYFDLQNQSESFGEEDCENLGHILKKVFFSEDSMSKDCQFIINLLGLGGSDQQSLCFLDSAAIRTDFVNLRRPTLSVKDILEISRGLGLLNHFQEKGSPFSVTSPTWNNILGKDVPAWAHITSELKNAAFFTHIPGTVTVQRLEGILEMEADCEVKDIFLVKDPIMRKPTGAAWVLFQDSKSCLGAIEWYMSGSALMYGTPFMISEIPLVVLDEAAEASSVAQKDINARERDQQKQLEQDRKMLDESQQLAAERAEYRELHPAYQGGRIS